ncbi:MAG: HemK2/MTQ2 family protein methyltransferase [Haloarculaceae archaeon]
MTRPDLADRRDVDEVYGPAEDSELLASVAAERVRADQRVLDVGTGSGFVAARVAEIGATVVGVDVSPLACRRARENGVDVVRGDLVAPFRDDAFDVVLFNPPYLPTPGDEGWGDWMDLALSGGETGRAVIDPFLETVGRVLAPGGTVYLLVSTLTGVDEVRDRAMAAGLEGAPVGESSHPFEKLLVLALTRTDD